MLMVKTASLSGRLWVEGFFRPAHLVYQCRRVLDDEAAARKDYRRRKAMREPDCLQTRRRRRDPHLFCTTCRGAPRTRRIDTGRSGRDRLQHHNIVVPKRCNRNPDSVFVHSGGSQ